MKKLSIFAFSFFLFTQFHVFSEDRSIIIDVRTESEWIEGHLTSAIHLPIANFESSLPMLNEFKDHKIYLYCAAGRRAEKARNILVKAGFRNVTNAGGMNAASKLLDSEIIQ